MKKIKILGIVLSSIFIVYTSALADKGVFNAGTTPNETFINTPTTVKITAEVGSENLYISSVMAYQVDEDGRPIARLGQMYDDGTHGDETEADTIFTLEFEINESNKATFYYAVTAAYYRDRNRYMSTPMEVTIFEPLPEGIVDETVSAVQLLEDSFSTYLTSMDIETAKDVTLEDALNNPNITRAYLSGNQLIIIFEGLVKGIVELNDPNLPLVDAGVSDISAGDLRYPGNEQLLIFAPGYDDGQNQIADHAQSQFEDSEFFESDPNPPVITENSSASLEVVKNWDDYGTIIIHTHGGFDHDPIGESTDQVNFKSGTESSLFNQARYAFDILKGRIAASGGTFYFYPSFITKHVGSMKNSFIYMGACESLRDNSMWDALEAKGAKVGFGWSRTVFRNFNTAKFQELIDPMLPSDINDEPQTAKQAFDAIADKDDAHADPAVFTMKVSGGAASKWNNFTFGLGGIVNGDFETGDWTGWTTGGDYDFRIISGARKHDGNNSAALGRWDTAYHGHDDTAEPFGYEWMYQDFTVPNNVTTLKFYWWMETYDTAVWDWFDAYIKDTNGNTLKTILNKAGKPGTNYGPYWSTQMADGGTGWREVTVDISAYQGQEIRIYFDQRLDGFGDQQRVYIDDVTLE